jgi:quercetin dioxygenase-like cupin family protein
MKTWMMTAALAIAMLGTAQAEPPAMKRTELSRHDLAIKDREVVVTRGEFPAGAQTPKHTHPGDEVAFVLEGALTIELDGKPAVTVKAGETFFVPGGTVHQGKNLAKTQTVVISTYIIEKGKPLVQPVTK